MNEQSPHIVIAGGGFLGVTAAKALLSQHFPHGRKITLLDSRSVHVYTPDLYEIASAFKEEVMLSCPTTLKESVAERFKKIFSAADIELVCDSVIGIDVKKKIVRLKNHKALSYTFLVVGLGSVTNYYGIPGLEKHAQPFKTLSDALAIRCNLDILIRQHREKQKSPFHLVIGGGGATGVELACELAGYLNKLCKKYSMSRKYAQCTILEGSPLLGGLKGKEAGIIKKRLTELGITVRQPASIVSVSEKAITISSSGTQAHFPYDLLIWTGGVMAHPLIKENFTQVSPRGGLLVNEFLQSKEDPFVFAGGDNATCTGGDPLPLLAQVAAVQGPHIAANIAAYVQAVPMKPFTFSFKGVIIPLGGKRALFSKGSLCFSGFVVWVLRRLISLRHWLSILPVFSAVRKWTTSQEVFIGND